MALRTELRLPLTWNTRCVIKEQTYKKKSVSPDSHPAVVITDRFTLPPPTSPHPHQPPVQIGHCGSVFSAFPRTQRVNETGPRCLARAEACPSPIGPLHCFNLPTTALWKLSQIWVTKKGRGENKSANNIQMVPRLCSELCLKEWQVQPNHVEFFTLCHCLPTLTPSWAFSARPAFCQALLGRSPARTAGLAPSKNHAESDSSLYFDKTKRRLDALHQMSDGKYRKAPKRDTMAKLKPNKAKRGSRVVQNPRCAFGRPPSAFDWSSIDNVEM